MRDALWVALVGIGVYVALGLVMQYQTTQASAACGPLTRAGGIVAPDGSTVVGNVNPCPALAVVNARWAWYPVIPWA